MKNKRVVVFGSLPIASRIVQFLLDNEAAVVAVVGTRTPHNGDPWTDTPLLADFCNQKGVPIYELNQFAELFDNGYFDLGLSCRFSKIISDCVIKKFKNGIINMHGGLLPEVGGLYSCNHSILLGAQLGGGTLHYVDPGIDTGDIIKWCSFKIEADDTGFSVFQKTQIELEKGMREVLPEAVEHRIKGIKQSDLVASGRTKGYFGKKSLDGLKQLNFDELGTDKADRVIRAFDFPGYEPAYFINQAGHKVYLRVSP